MKRVEKKTRALQPGELVEILWLDSGRTSSSRTTQLARRHVYGRVHAVTDDALTLAMDVCEGEDEHDDSGNEWAIIWIPAVLECNRLVRE